MNKVAFFLRYAISFRIVGHPVVAKLDSVSRPPNKQDRPDNNMKKGAGVGGRI